MRPPLMSTLTWRYPCQSQDEAVQAVCGGLSGKRQTLFGRPGVSIWLACIATTHDQDRRGGEEEMKGEELVLFQDFWLTPSRKVGREEVSILHLTTSSKHSSASAASISATRATPPEGWRDTFRKQRCDRVRSIGDDAIHSNHA